MTLAYMLYLTTALSLPADNSNEAEMSARREQHQMLAEMNTSQQRKSSKKQDKKSARQSDGQRRDARRETRRGKDIKSHRREIPNASRDRIETQKGDRRSYHQDRQSRKRAV